jgi:hypothetical protein
MVEYIEAWQCIGCGRLEAARPCIGVCEDRKASFVAAADYEARARELEAERSRSAALVALVRQLAWTTPRGEDWRPSYRALQAKARALLARSDADRGEAAPVPDRPERLPP